MSRSCRAQAGLLRQQGLEGPEQAGAPLAGRLGQGGQYQLRGRVHVLQLLGQLLHHELEAEPAHLRGRQWSSGHTQMPWRGCHILGWAEW